jgi:hypothetical protein
VLADVGGELTGAGEGFLTGLGIDLGKCARKRRYCRSCID